MTLIILLSIGVKLPHLQRPMNSPRSLPYLSLLWPDSSCLIPVEVLLQLCHSIPSTIQITAEPMQSYSTSNLNWETTMSTQGVCFSRHLTIIATADISFRIKAGGERAHSVARYNHNGQYSITIFSYPCPYATSLDCRWNSLLRPPVLQIHPLLLLLDIPAAISQVC